MGRQIAAEPSENAHITTWARAHELATSAVRAGHEQKDCEGPWLAATPEHDLKKGGMSGSRVGGGPWLLRTRSRAPGVRVCMGGE